jgi:hypothetical protein
MKASSLYFALSAAQLAICAPATVATERQNHAPDTVDNAATARRTWTTYLDENEAAGRDRHDPRGRPEPFYPAHGELLPPLSKHRIHEPVSSRPGQEPLDVDAIHVPPPKPNADDVPEPLDLDATAPARPGMPCHHARPSQERNDMLVVFLAVAFLVVVVVVETWGSLFRRWVLPGQRRSAPLSRVWEGVPEGLTIRSDLYRQGTIRLEESTNQPPLSIRANPDDQDGIGDEKRRL